MNIRPNIKTGISVCPHDCPSACALEVELLDANTIGRVRGSKENSYTLGVICEKVARYAERIHHPERLLYPLKRKGPIFTCAPPIIANSPFLNASAPFCNNVLSPFINTLNWGPACNERKLPINL